jgi:hypothetical protein
MGLERRMDWRLWPPAMSGEARGAIKPSDSRFSPDLGRGPARPCRRDGRPSHGAIAGGDTGAHPPCKNRMPWIRHRCRQSSKPCRRNLPSLHRPTAPQLPNPAQRRRGLRPRPRSRQSRKSQSGPPGQRPDRPCHKSRSNLPPPRTLTSRSNRNPRRANWPSRRRAYPICGPRRRAVRRGRRAAVSNITFRKNVLTAARYTTRRLAFRPRQPWPTAVTRPANIAIGSTAMPPGIAISDAIITECQGAR